MANKLKVEEQEAIRNLTVLGWGIRRIARELRVSRNTVRNYVRILKQEDPEVLTERIITSGLSKSQSEETPAQTDPLSTPGSSGRPSLCAQHAQIILRLGAPLTNTPGVGILFPDA